MGFDFHSHKFFLALPLTSLHPQRWRSWVWEGEEGGAYRLEEQGPVSQYLEEKQGTPVTWQQAKHKPRLPVVSNGDESDTRRTV